MRELTWRGLAWRVGERVFFLVLIYGVLVWKGADFDLLEYTMISCLLLGAYWIVVDPVVDAVILAVQWAVANLYLKG